MSLYWGDDLINITPQMKRRIVHFASTMPFDKVSQLFEAEYGIIISTSWIQDLTDEVGAYVENEVLTVIPDANPVTKSDTHIIQVDGSHVPMKKGWEEAKTLVIGKLANNNDSSNHKYSDKYFHATKKDVRIFENDIHAIVSKRRIRDGTVVVMGDGAKWIWKMYRRLFRNCIEILDFYHASEYIHEAMKIIFGEKSIIGSEKASFFCHAVKHSNDGADLIINYISQNLDNKSLAEYKFRLKQIIVYFNNNKDRMKYKIYKKKGLPIGTGLVESTQKWLIQSRLKQAGMHWSGDGASQMISLQVMIANKLYNSWFEKRLAA